MTEEAYQKQIEARPSVKSSPTSYTAISPIDKKLLKYFTQLNDFQKKSLLELIKSFLESEDVLGGQTIDQYNQELDQAMERISRSEFISLEELEREMKSW